MSALKRKDFIVNSSTLFVSLVFLGGCAQLATSPQNESSSSLPSSTATPNSAAPAFVNTVEPPLLPGALRDDYPPVYTVQAGDTLYDVSSKYLQEPWRWQGLWSGAAPQLYPGNILQVSTNTSNTPKLQLAVGERPTIKLSPQVRVEAVNAAIPTIPSEVIAPFLDNAVVLSKADWQSAPYIIGNDNSDLLGSVGMRVYARGGDLYEGNYRIYRPGDQLREPGSSDSLGYVMTYVGEAIVEAEGDPIELRVIDAERGVRPGDRLIRVEEEPATVGFVPRPVPEDTDGRVISALDAGLVIGHYNNVAVNLGAYDGMEPGHVLAAYQPGSVATDPVTGEQIRLPENRSGVIILYKVFDLVSYGLVAEAPLNIRLNDRVGKP